MSILTRPKFADLVGVSPVSIHKALKAGHLVLTADGRIDTDDERNAGYIAQRQKAKIEAAIILPSSGRHPTASPPKSPPKKPEPRISVGPPPGSSEATVSPPPSRPRGSKLEGIDALVERQARAASLDADKKKAQIQLWHAQRDRHQLAIAEKKGELIPRDLERRRWSAFDAALKSNFRDLPRRIAASLHATATSGTAQDLERELEAEISDALRRCIAAAKKQGLEN